MSLALPPPAIRIGTHQLSGWAGLAPMAGVTDRPFRLLCKRLGAAWAVGEMLSANPDTWNSEKSRLRRLHHGEPGPIWVQIAGSEPQRMARCAQREVDDGAEIVDINMGCPAKKVCQKAAGSALLADEALVGRILEAVCAAVSVPVSLKIRTGPTITQRNAVRIARIAEAAGVQALALHGRTREQMFRGAAEHETLAEVVQAVRIPVFANGDLETANQTVELIRRSAAAGALIGRAAQGNPWIFQQIADRYAGRPETVEPDLQTVKSVLIEHLDALHQHYGPERGLRVARKHIGWYLDGRAHDPLWRSQLMTVDQAEQQRTLICAWNTAEPALDRAA